jgi:hypothetical protein
MAYHHGCNTVAWDLLLRVKFMTQHNSLNSSLPFLGSHLGSAGLLQQQLGQPLVQLKWEKKPALKLSLKYIPEVDLWLPTFS